MLKNQIRKASKFKLKLSPWTKRKTTKTASQLERVGWRKKPNLLFYLLSDSCDLSEAFIITLVTHNETLNSITLCHIVENIDEKKNKKKKNKRGTTNSNKWFHEEKKLN